MPKIEKIRNFSFINPINGAQIGCRPLGFLPSCFRFDKYLYFLFKFFVWRGCPLLGLEKSQKTKVKRFGQNYRKFHNFLEVPTWHESKKIDQFRDKNEIHRLFPPFNPLSLKCTSRFLLPNIDKCSFNRLVIACRSFFDTHNKL